MGIALLVMLSNITAAANNSQFEIGSPGYLMRACEDTLANRATFESGYCVGIYRVVHSSKLLSLGTIGTDYCPSKTMDTDVNIALVVKYIKNTPKTWRTGDDYYSVELALKDAWPCAAKK